MEKTLSQWLREGIEYTPHNPDGVDWELTRAKMDEAADALDLAEKALEAFEAHYPHGLNPYCDDAVNQARTALKAIKGVE